MNFPEKKKALSVFKYSNYLLPCQKSEKTNEPFLRKMPTWQMERQMDRQTDGQTDNSDFIGPSIDWGSKKEEKKNVNNSAKECQQSLHTHANLITSNLLLIYGVKTKLSRLHTGSSQIGLF